MKSCCGCCFPLPKEDVTVPGKKPSRGEVDVRQHKPPTKGGDPVVHYGESRVVNEYSNVDNSRGRVLVETRSYSPGRDGQRENLHVDYHQDVDWARESRAKWETDHPGSQVVDNYRTGQNVVYGSSYPQAQHVVSHVGGTTVPSQGVVYSQAQPSQAIVRTGGSHRGESRVIQGGSRVVQGGTTSQVVTSGSRVVAGNQYNPFNSGR